MRLLGIRLLFCYVFVYLAMLLTMSFAMYVTVVPAQCLFAGRAGTPCASMCQATSAAGSSYVL